MQRCLNKLSNWADTIFDRKLSFIPHIKHLREKCTKALNLLRVVSHTTWGADQQTLLHLYRSLIRSKLDYGCVVYGSAQSSYLRMLDPVQNQALCLCLGAYRTSPSSSLCVLANEPPLYLRRKKFSMQYCLKLLCADVPLRTYTLTHSVVAFMQSRCVLIVCRHRMPANKQRPPSHHSYQSSRVRRTVERNHTNVVCDKSFSQSGDLQ